LSGHLSMRPTWTSPGRVDGPAWPCTGRGLPGRRVTAAPVRSYRTISPLPVRGSRVAAPSAVSFCGTFPRVSPGGRYPPPRPVVSGLSSRGFLSPRGPLGPPVDGSSRAGLGQAGAGIGGGHAKRGRDRSGRRVQAGEPRRGPRPPLFIPRWRGTTPRLFSLFPRLTIRLLPALLWDARRRRRRYKRPIEAGRCPDCLGHRHAAASVARPGQTLRKTPTTRPRTLASVVRIGSIWSFSGCSRTWSFSR
jgi:hypothetical protein